MRTDDDAAHHMRQAKKIVSAVADAGSAVIAGASRLEFGAASNETVTFAANAGGTLVLAGIHMSTIPAMDYNLLYWERVVRSVANNTRQDGEDFLRVAAEIPIHTKVQTFPLVEANRALNALKSDEVTGAAVIQVAAN